MVVRRAVFTLGSPTTSFFMLGSLNSKVSDAATQQRSDRTTDRAEMCAVLQGVPAGAACQLKINPFLYIATLSIFCSFRAKLSIVSIKCNGIYLISLNVAYAKGFSLKFYIFKLFYLINSANKCNQQSIVLAKQSIY